MEKDYLIYKNVYVIKCEDGFFLYNISNQSSVLLDNPLNIKLNDFEQVITPNIYKELSDNEIIYENPLFETGFNRFYSNYNKYSRICFLIDAYTYCCNMNCIYCFENKLKKVKTLDKTDRTLLFSNLIEMYECDLINFTFFGGESLIDIDYVEFVSSFLHIFSLNCNKNLRISFISNGTLITDRFIKLCNEYSFEEIMITLDGTKEIHNSRRILKTENDSYSLILDNIKRLVEKTNIRIKINVVLDEKNYGSIIHMARELIAIFGKAITSDDPRIYFNVGELCHPFIETEHTKKYGSDKCNLESLYFSCANSLIDLGCSISSPVMSCQCTNSTEKSFVISPEGDIYKCMTGLGHNEFLLSNYSDYCKNPSILFNNNILQVEHSHKEECLNCKYLSMCNGGCKFQHKINKECLCRKDIFKNEMFHFLKLMSKIKNINGFMYKKR